MAEPIRVLIAESQGPLRTGLSTILRADPDITIVGEARDGLEAIKKARELKPEVILIATSSDKGDRLDILSMIRANLPTSVTVVLADSEEEDDVFRALSCGVRGYLLKSTPDAEMAQALKQAAAGEVVLSPRVAAVLANGLRENVRAPKLSQREAEVLRLLGEGLKNREIATRLIVGESTVRTYIYRLQEKLGLKNRHEVSIHAGRHLLNFARIEERLKPLERYSQSALRHGLIRSPASEVAAYAPESEQARHTLKKASAARTPVLPERKIVTALSAELTWYNCATKPFDANKIEETINECRDLVTEEIQRYGGTAVWFTSSGLMSFFGVPVSLEHAPQKALHAALAIQEHVKGFNEQLTSRDIRVNARIGINTGAVLVESDTSGSSAMFKPIGDTTELATKAWEAAEPGAIVVTQSTYNLTEHEFDFEPLGEVQVDEQKQRVNIHRLVEVRARNRKPAKVGLRRLTKFVGRDKEIDALKKAFSRAKSGSGQVVGIVGEAGVGKSRLLLEFTRQLRSDKYVYLEGSCRYYGESVAYLPLLQILRVYFNITGEERESIIKKRINKKIGQLDSGMLKLVPPLQEILGFSVDDEEYGRLEVMQKRERIFEAIRDILLRQSQDRPVILAIEDCQWIDKTSEEFLPHLINSLPSARMMMLLLYRPEYHHSWTTKSYYQHIGLNQLSRKASAELMNSILGASASPELGELVLTKAGGNPMFIEELTKALLENGSIERKDHEYVLAEESSEIAVPATIQGIIAARLDCLGGDLKRTLQTASVIGRDFSFGLLQIIAGMPQQLKFHLQDLLGLEFIYRNGLDPKSEYVFKHALIQDVAYHSLPLRTRKKLHERIGDTIEQLYPDRLEEFYETLAHHYSRSANLEQAYRYLKLSGDKATRSFSNREAFRFCKEAISTLHQMPQSEENQRRGIEIRFSIAAPILCLGFPEDSLQIIQEGAQLSKELGDGRSLASFHSWMGMYYSFRGQAVLGIQYSESSFLEAEKVNDIDLMARAAVDLCTAYHFSGKDYLKMIDVASKVIALLEKTQRQSESFGSLVNPYCAMLSYCSMAMNFIGDFRAGQDLYEKGLSFALEIKDLTVLGLLEVDQGMSLVLLKGDSHHGIKYLQDCIKHCEEGQLFITLGNAWIGLGIGYYVLGEPETARKYIEKGIKMNSDAGMRELLSAYYVTLSMIDSDSGDLERAQGRAEEALRLSQENQEMWPEGLSRVILGRVLGKRNERPLAKAEASILAGIKILEEVKVKPIVAQAQFYLGELYADSGQTKKALACLKRAEGMCQEMGMDYWLRKTQPLLQKLETSVS